MLKFLILVVQNSLTTAVLLAVLFALLYAAKNRGIKKWLLGGLAAGAGTALVLSVLKYSTALINREYVNTAVLSVAIPAAVLFCILSRGALSGKASKTLERLHSAVAAVLTASLLLYCLPDIFLYPASFVMAGESILSTDFLFALIGYACGLLIVLLSGFALFKAAGSLTYKQVRILLTIGLAMNIVNQTTAIVQFLLARRIVTASWVFDAIKPVINHNEIFMYGILAIAAILPVLTWIKSLHPNEAYANPAQRRRILAGGRNLRRWCAVIAVGFILAVLSVTALKAYDEREAVLSSPEPMTIVGSEIVIPLENVDDGHLHRFVYTASGNTEVRFIVIKKNSASYGVGLDACDICGPTGYYERGDHEVVCKLCDVVMNISTIGFKGGCNPVPLAYTLNGGNMMIQTQSLENEKKRFE